MALLSHKIRSINAVEIYTQLICSQIYITILVKFYLSFYFKIMHRALPCNHTLSKNKNYRQLNFVIMFQTHLHTCSGSVPMCKNYEKQFGTLFLYSQQKY